MKNQGLVVLLTAHSLVGAGCATLFQGGTQAINVTSEPTGAQVFVGDNLVGVTPTRVFLERKRSGLVLRLEKERYVVQSVPLKRSLSPSLVADLPYGLLASWGASNVGEGAIAVAFPFCIDFLTGAAYRLGPSKVHMTLVPQPTDPPRPSSAQDEGAASLTDKERTEARDAAREWVQARKRPNK